MAKLAANNRVVIVAIALTVAATFYSLSELHRFSAEHTARDERSSFTTQLETGSKRDRHAQDTTGTVPREVGIVSKHTPPPKQTLELTQTVAAATTSAKKCYSYEHTELWGEAVVWGTSNFAESAEECCNQCKNYVPEKADDFDCNVWVYCGNQAKCAGLWKQCWLKHVAHPEASKPQNEGPRIPWTSGTIDVDLKSDPLKNKKDGEKEKLRPYHVVTSAQGSAVHWQIRIHYYWYKKQKHQCEQDGECEMGGFTRLLHSGQPDELVDEIPTMVVDPLPSDMVQHDWYVVLNRPYAFVEWVKKAQIPEKYVLMAEPDHVMIRPLPNFMTSERPASYPFFYIVPSKPEYQPIVMKFTGKLTRSQFEEIAPIGNSPTFMSMKDMEAVMPLWLNASISIFKDAEASKAWGWVQEMYGFTLGVWLAGIKKVDLFLHLMAQPPWDFNLELAPGKPFYIIHYTYGMDYKLTGEFTPGKYGEWRFDKRSYGGKPIPRRLGPPPEKMNNDLVRNLINSFNEATAAIPCWDKYVETGIAAFDCGEKPGGFLALEEEQQLKQKGKS